LDCCMLSASPFPAVDMLGCNSNWSGRKKLSKYSNSRT
jgi:hypothetical protein